MSANKPQYKGISHAGILVADTTKSLVSAAAHTTCHVLRFDLSQMHSITSFPHQYQDFYLNVLGFEDDTSIRPNLPFKGAFVRGGSQQIHLMELPNPDPVSGRPDHAGRDRHVAFEIQSIDPLIERLNEKGHPFTMSKSGRRAVFTRDVDGNGLEFLEPVVDEKKTEL